MDGRGRLAPLGFGLLGPLEVRSDGAALPLGGARQRALLALLLLHANTPVPRSRLVDGVWGERPPETAANALQVAVHGLRKILGRDRLETRAGGYLLRVEPGELDLQRAEELLGLAREADDPGRAADALREALALWRGAPLADLRDAPFAHVEAARLEELRLSALERRIAAELDAGAGEELVGELRTIVSAEPYRERFHGQLVLALYRAGRQAEALEALRAARRLLVEGLGVEPSPALQELERRVLRQDPELLPAAPAPPAPTNLPVAPTRLIGRELELAAVTSLLRGDARLLTLTGPGGTGKTRLGLAAAAELTAEFPDGVWFVPLAPLRDPALVAGATADALGVEESGGTVLDRLKERLRARRTLLLLDNFEHLLAAAPVVSDLLAAAPGLRVLVTSRSILRLSGEHDYPVAPLPLPDPTRTADPAELARNEAVALFVERARAARPGFRLDDHGQAVAGICVAVDGLPLALELAAARVKVLAPDELLTRLERRLPLLVRGPADLPARQQTLRGTIDWSHDLLEGGERELLARLSVFAGGCTYEDAEAVCGADLDRLASLVEKSLLRERTTTPNAPRFAMLETVREYAAERLGERGEEEGIRRRHAEHFTALAEASEQELTGQDAAGWLARLDAEQDNLRAALAWAAASGATELELRLATALQPFWRLRGHATEGCDRLEGALARGSNAPAALRARALSAAGVLVDHRGDHGAARRLLEQAVELFRRVGDRGREARALSELGGIAVLVGEYERAVELFEATIPLFRETGDGRALMVTTSNLASVVDLQGDHERGGRLAREALALARAGGDRDQTAICLHNIARSALGQGKLEDVAGPLAESIRIGAELGFRELIANCLEGFGELAAALGELQRSGRLLGAARALLDEIDATLGPEEQEGYERTIARLEQELGAEALAALLAEGRALPLDAALASAVSPVRPD